MITAVQETKWTGVEIWDTKTHTIFSSGKNKSAKEGGVAFVVDRSIRANAIDVILVNERICMLRLRASFFNISIIISY